MLPEMQAHTIICIMTVFFLPPKKPQVQIPEPKCTSSMFALSVFVQIFTNTVFQWKTKTQSLCKWEYILVPWEAYISVRIFCQEREREKSLTFKIWEYADGSRSIKNSRSCCKTLTTLWFVIPLSALSFHSEPRICSKHHDYFVIHHLGRDWQSTPVKP